MACVAKITHGELEQSGFDAFQSSGVVAGRIGSYRLVQVAPERHLDPKFGQSLFCVVAGIPGGLIRMDVTHERRSSIGVQENVGDLLELDDRGLPCAVSFNDRGDDRLGLCDCLFDIDSHGLGRNGSVVKDHAATLSGSVPHQSKPPGLPRLRFPEFPLGRFRIRRTWQVPLR